MNLYLAERGFHGQGQYCDVDELVEFHDKTQRRSVQYNVFNGRGNQQPMNTHGEEKAGDTKAYTNDDKHGEEAVPTYCQRGRALPLLLAGKQHPHNGHVRQ